ncbi:formin-binding protein [Exophiala sideris]|nr:formin-binding protein [Exophiala sideris]KAK5176869.1 formin-binding protein [Eurotiomycetes sp. CCFEE 6388]
MPPGTAAEAGAPPSVPLSFSNNFWGRDDAGVDPLLTRMQNAKTTCDELKAFYTARAALEEDYSKKLLSLSRKPLGSVEQGTLRASLDVARGETESMGKQHGLIAQQMKSELEEPLAAFAGGMKERRKIVQAGIEKLLKTKQAQTAHVNKARDKYEQDCLRIKGYLAQGHMVMGQEERKNKAKLEKTQINMAANSNEYEAAVKVLEETTGRWNKEWKAACDKFQDLEEERLDFTKSSLWAFANIASTVCVSDDASCEKVRLALENTEVEKDIGAFIKTCGTGQEIPDPPRYINFCRGDIDTQSEVSEDDKYSVAQFSRTTNPAFRSSSPTHSNGTRSTRHDTAQRMSEEPMIPNEDDMPTPSNSNSGRPPPLNYKQTGPHVPPNYSPSQHGDVPQVPHNQYPTDGMTMFCRTAASSVAGSALSSNTRPESRDSESQYSAPSSFTSAEPMSGATSPIKMAPVNGVDMPGMASPDKSVHKKRSGFFSNSPFRRKSRKDLDPPEISNAPRSTTWSSEQGTGGRINLNPSVSSTHSSPTKFPNQQGQSFFNRAATLPDSEEPVDPRANFQLNVGNNVFDVASPDGRDSTPKASTANRRGQFLPPPSAMGDAAAHDPIAQALADLKRTSNGVTGMAKQSSTRVPVDRYHGVATPNPDQDPAARPGMMSAESQARMAAQRGTPPPAYDSSGGRAQSALGVPQPAHTKKEMLNRTETWGTGPVGSTPRGGQPRPSTRDGRRSPGPGMMRAASPQPQGQYQQRSRSPAPGMIPRAASPQPQRQDPYMRSRSPGPAMMQQGDPQYRSASPNPYAAAGRPRTQGSGSRQGSGMEMQLSSSDVARYDGSGGGSARARQSMRPKSSFGGDRYPAPQGYDGRESRQRGGSDMELRRERSKSLANIPFRPAQAQVLHHARAMYSYTAAIPEELTFSKGDILAVLRLQDDGWWEAEVRESTKGTRCGGVGLVPSNYLQRC